MLGRGGIGLVHHPKEDIAFKVVSKRCFDVPVEDMRA